MLSESVDKISSAFDSSKAFSLSSGMSLTLCPSLAVSPSAFFLLSSSHNMVHLLLTTQSHKHSQEFVLQEALLLGKGYS